MVGMPIEPCVACAHLIVIFPLSPGFFLKKKPHALMKIITGIFSSKRFYIIRFIMKGGGSTGVGKRFDCFILC